MKLLFVFVLLFLASCMDKKSEPSQFQWKDKNPAIPMPEAFAMDSDPYLIEGARIMTANGQVYEKANLYMKNGLIQKISEDKIKVDENTIRIDGSGLTLTPGIIDVHSHMGVYPSPSVDAHEDGNEMVRPITADVWAEHGFWPQDPDLWRALAGGVTTIQVLPGSGNLMGGRSFTAKLIPKLSAREMRFPDAPQGLKMACGENPKRVYKEKSIMTRMGNVAGYRKEFQEAIEYVREWENKDDDKSKDKDGGKLPKRNLVLETLAKVLKGEILVHFHCYRADDISAILDVANEFGFKIRTIHHGLEAYKIAARLAKENVAVATWADWWGFKAEAYDGIPYNAALLEKAGAKAIIHSDSATDVRFLNIEAGKALAAAKKLDKKTGLDFTEDQALAWITKNAAWALGLSDKIGTLEEGKMADIVVWDGHPFSVYSKAKKVFINGKIAFDRQQKIRPRSDFEVGFNDHSFFDGRDFQPPQTRQNFTWPNYQLPDTAKQENSFVVKDVNAFINGQWQPNVTVMVLDGKVTSINPKNIPQEYKSIDGKGKFLTSGLIDSISALGLYEISLDSQAQDTRNNSQLPTPDYRAADSLNTRNIRLPIIRHEGVLTSLVHIEGNIASSTGAAFDLVEDRLINPAVAVYGSIEKPYGGNPPIRSAIWNQLRTFLEDAIYYNNNLNAYQSGQSRPLLTSHRHLAAMKPVIKGEIPWVIQAHRAQDIKSLAELKKEFKAKKIDLNIVIYGGAEAWMVSELLTENNIPVIIVPTEQTPSTFNKTHARFDQAAYLSSKGVQVIIDDSDGNGSSRTRQEAGMAVRYGMRPEEALKAITETPGKVFKLNRGKIAPGSLANLVLWSNDPLEPTSWAEKIWIAGEEQPLLTRQRELADKYLNAQ